MPADAEALLDRTFHALADASRRSIVVRLSRGPASVSELADADRRALDRAAPRDWEGRLDRLATLTETYGDPT